MAIGLNCASSGGNPLDAQIHLIVVDSCRNHYYISIWCIWGSPRSRVDYQLENINMAA